MTLNDLVNAGIAIRADSENQFHKAIKYLQGDPGITYQELKELTQLWVARLKALHNDDFLAVLNKVKEADPGISYTTPNLSDYKVITTYVNPTGKPGKQFTINDLNLYTIFKKVDNEEVERDMQKEITQILKNRNEEEAEKLINYLTRQVMLDQGDRQVTYKFVDPNKALKNRENLVKEMEELYYQMFGMYPPGSENKEEQPPEETKKTVNIGDTSGFTKYLPAIIAGGILLILIIKAG